LAKENSQKKKMRDSRKRKREPKEVIKEKHQNEDSK